MDAQEYQDSQTKIPKRFLRIQRMLHEENANVDIFESNLNELQLIDPIPEKELEVLYTWVDNVPLSRPKKNIMRDFADCHLIAQIIRFYLPQAYKGIIQVHNYVETMNKQIKYDNWNQLNQKVFAKFQRKFQLTEEDIKGVVKCQNGAIERVLRKVKAALERFIADPPDDLKASTVKHYIEENLAQK